MHSVKPGPANQSYGLQVARLAGIPAQAIALARQKLQLLEQQSLQAQGDLFAELPPQEDPAPHALLAELETVDPDELSPKQALELIYHLKQLAKS
jgi:DNA mismatch repair protein MutS